MYLVQDIHNRWIIGVLSVCEPTLAFFIEQAAIAAIQKSRCMALRSMYYLFHRMLFLCGLFHVTLRK